MAKTEGEIKNVSDQIHPEYDNGQFIEMTKVDRTQEYDKRMNEFKEVCKGMSEDELAGKIDEVEQILGHVDDSLKTQLMARPNGNHISKAMRETAFTKGLIEDQLKHVKDLHVKLIGENVN